MVKLQIITLSAKLLALSSAEGVIGLLGRYIFSLARYDLDYDVRDRARMLTSLLAGLSPSLRSDDAPDEVGGVILRREQVRLVLFNGKADVIEDIKGAGE